MNGYAESCNDKLGDELLNRETLTILIEARILIEQRRKEYNQIRSHGSTRRILAMISTTIFSLSLNERKSIWQVFAIGCRGCGAEIKNRSIHSPEVNWAM